MAIDRIANQWCLAAERTVDCLGVWKAVEFGSNVLPLLQRMRAAKSTWSSFAFGLSFIGLNIFSFHALMISQLSDFLEGKEHQPILCDTKRSEVHKR